MLNFKSSLENIANDVKIDLFNAYIAHNSFGKSCSLASQINKLPKETSLAFFHHNLVEFIYKIYFNGYYHYRSLIADNDNSFPYLMDTLNEIDWNFYKLIDAANNSKKWLHPYFHITQEIDNNTLIVEFDNAILEINKQVHLPAIYQNAKVGDPVAVYLPNSYIDENMYMAHGDYSGGHPPLQPYKYVLVITFNFFADAAPYIMELITRKLNEYKIDFGLVIPLNPLNYIFFNTGILKIFCRQYDSSIYSEHIFPLLKTIYTECNNYFRDDVPIFSKCLAPGIGILERNMHGRIKQSFDSETNYCDYIASGLIDAEISEDNSFENKMNCILSCFEKYNVNIDKPYVNPGFPDIYTPIV
jgi:HopA1 effector protein family